MSEQELNKLIARKITYYLEEKEKSQQDLANYLNVSQATISNWCQGIKMPRMDKIDKICSYFNITRSDLMEEKSSKSTDTTVDKLDMNTLRKLNDTNITKVNTYAQNLLNVQLMEDEPVLIAAHNDNPNEEQQALIREDLKLLKKPD